MYCLVPNQETGQYIPCSCELLSSDNDWQISWKLCRLRGLSSEMTSFNFKLLHRLLPVKDRLHKITPTTPATCTLCSNSQPETLEHALLSCAYNAGTGHALFNALQRVLPSLTADQLLLLHFDDITETQELPLVFLSTAILMDVWNRRKLDENEENKRKLGKNWKKIGKYKKIGRKIGRK